MKIKDDDVMRRQRSHCAILSIILLVKVVGVLGLVGLLVAGHYFPASEYICRVLALVWFAVCGVAYVLLSSRVKVRGRRWP